LLAQERNEPKKEGHPARARIRFTFFQLAELAATFRRDFGQAASKEF
jgi:hypothetical protein